VDVLTDLMQLVRLRSHVYGRVELTAPWGMRCDPSDRSGFFIVSRGNCWLELDGEKNQIPLAGGDFVFFPKGGGHILRDAPNTPAVPVAEILKAHDCTNGGVLRYGGNGAPVSLICGCFAFEDGGRNPLVECLPPMIHVKADSSQSVRWLEATLQFVASETASTLPGADTVSSRLADILFVHAVRAHLVTSECKRGLLNALTDPEIGAALRLIHERTGDVWTVEALAKAVAMSRSAFAARFTELVGQSPLRYITSLRVQKASQMLLQGTKISVIAQAVGYETEAAFGKAFKRYLGTTPGDFRRAAGVSLVSNRLGDYVPAIA
jgi:AraC-like DNA-binding protein